MARSPHDLARVAALSAIIASACTFEDGRPWEEARVRLTVSFEVPEDRVLDGRIRTAHDYAVRLERIGVTLERLRIAQSATSDGSTTFDPASPPAGYSLCHNGHCHADDGRVVDYAEIEAETLSEAATGAVTEAILQREVDVPPGGTIELPVERLDLPAGALVTLGLVVTELRLEGRVDDLRSARRLATDDMPFDLSVPVDVDLDAKIPESSGTLEPTLALPIQLLDVIDYSGDGLSPVDAAGLLSGTLGLKTTP